MKWLQLMILNPNPQKVTEQSRGHRSQQGGHQALEAESESLSLMKSNTGYLIAPRWENLVMFWTK